jgi:hypothetical protein
MKTWLSIFSFIFTSGCVSVNLHQPFHYPEEDSVEARQLMIGSWLGVKHFEDGRIQRWLVKRQPDGIYFVHFQIIETNGEMDEWQEVGVWGVRKPIYFTAMRGFVENDNIIPADTDDAVFYDAYRIIELNEQQFTYRSFTSGNEFSLNKVADDFSLDGSQMAAASHMEGEVFHTSHQ